MYQRKLRQVCSVLPPQLAAMVSQLPPEQEEQLEELRLRCGSEITMVCGGREQPLSLTRPMLCTRDLLEHLVNLASSYSTYAVEECLRQGYLSLEGGHRLGLCGTAVVQDGRIATIKDISSVNLRVAGQHLGCATSLLDALGPNPGNVLLVGPPGSGKTTLLRDLVRQLSDRLDQRVGVVDSRGEIAASVRGQPQMQVGRRTDVLTGVPKDQGLELLVRTMSPHWVAVDEITAKADIRAMVRAGYCGVRLLATAHAFGREDWQRRALYEKLRKRKIFTNLVFLDGKRRWTLERVEEGC